MASFHGQHTHWGSRFYPPPMTQPFQKIWIGNLAQLSDILFLFKKC